jgi:hypothetical protein
MAVGISTILYNFGCDSNLTSPFMALLNVPHMQLNRVIFNQFLLLSSGLIFVRKVNMIKVKVPEE